MSSLIYPKDDSIAMHAIQNNAHYLSSLAAACNCCINICDSDAYLQCLRILSPYL